MSRRRPEKRIILPDPKFGDIVLSKFMNNLMLDGKSQQQSVLFMALWKPLKPAPRKIQFRPSMKR